MEELILRILLGVLAGVWFWLQCVTAFAAPPPRTSAWLGAAHLGVVTAWIVGVTAVGRALGLTADTLVLPGLTVGLVEETTRAWGPSIVGALWLLAGPRILAGVVVGSRHVRLSAPPRG